MANKTLFACLGDALIPQTDTVNSENAPAYALAPKQALAQYAATGCFGRTFYATADEQLSVAGNFPRQLVGARRPSSFL
jgi:60 kDa SS-A/Ro ribonucleoprotein